MKIFKLNKNIIRSLFLILIFFVFVISTNCIKAATSAEKAGELYYGNSYVMANDVDEDMKNRYNTKQGWIMMYDMKIKDEDCTFRVFCLHPGKSAHDYNNTGKKYNREVNVLSGAQSYTDTIADKLVQGSIISNPKTQVDFPDEVGMAWEHLSTVAYKVIAAIIEYGGNNDRSTYYQKQLVIWRICARFNEISKDGNVNTGTTELLSEADIKDLKSDIGKFGISNDKIESLVKKANETWYKGGSNLTGDNFEISKLMNGVRLYLYGNNEYDWDSNTQMLIGFNYLGTTTTPDPGPTPPPTPSTTYYNVKISRYYQDTSGNNVWTFTDRNGSYEKGTTIKYDVPDYDIINTITGIGKSNSLNFTVNGNVDIKIYYKVGRIKLKNHVTDELNKSTTYDEVFLKYSDGSNVYLYGSASVNLGGEYKGYKYKGVSWSGNTRNWNTTSIQIGRSKDDVTINAYYGLRHVYIGYFNKNGDSITPMKNISKMTYPDSGSFSNDIKITSSSNSTIYSGNNKYVYTNSGIYSGASNSPQAIYTTNIKNPTRWKWYSNINGKLKYDDVYNTTYITDQNKKPNNFSGEGITIKGLTTAYNQIPENSSFSIHFYYKIEKPMKVYIRHYVKNSSGTYDLDNTIANTEEVWYNSELSYNHGNDTLSSTEWYKVSNGFNQRKFGTTSNWNNSKDTVGSSYSEVYTLDKKDWLMVDRSRTIIKDGYIYNCTGCKKRTSIGTQQENGWANQSNTKLSIRSSEEGKKSEDTYSVYINYYYEKEDYSNDDPGGDSSYTVNGKKTTDISNTIIGKNAELKFTPKTRDNNLYKEIGGLNGNIAYVPVLENLKPYIKTSICMPRNLVYKIESVSTESKNSNGTISKSAKVTYGIEKYTALGIKLDNSANVFDITGSGNDKVYSNGGTSTPIKSDNSNLEIRIRDTKNTLQGVNASKIFGGTINKNKTDILSVLKKVTDDTKTNESDFKDDPMYDIKESKYNGMRYPNGVAYYVEYNLINNTYGSKIYSSKISNDKSMNVNIYTPMQVDSADIQTVNFVNHSNNTNAHIIQKGAEFTLTPKINVVYKGGCYNTNLPEITKYLKGYYVIFGFEVRTSVATFEAGRPIWVSAGKSITATPTAYEGEEAIKQLHETIQVIAVTKNASDDLRLKAYGTINGIGDKDKANNVPIKLGIGTLPVQTSTVTSENLNNYEAYDIDMKYDSHYFVKRDTVTTTIARLYDFKITDCYDIDFKNVFRKSGNNDVNSATGIQYFSGIKALNIYTKGYNDVVNRTGINISNSNSKLILPLGPYKNTNTSYVKAPKLGYRISFDVKTYGYYNYTPGNNSNIIRTVNIEPEYYYISKDGSKIIDNVKLYYKNSQGKYVTFDQSSYNISFKPNDGYRFIQNLNATDKIDLMSDKLIDLNVGKSFTLDSRMMSTSSDNFVQAWYGEYKVPSSTIVVDNTSGKIDLNKPLTDGYLGVKFIIKCIDKDPQNNSTVEVMYSNQDKKASGVNTTQWDYEGYLGYNGNGNEISSSSPLKLQLEKGTLNVDQSTYEKIRGTVVLYDIDNRAASDFD